MLGVMREKRLVNRSRAALNDGLGLQALDVFFQFLLKTQIHHGLRQSFLEAPEIRSFRGPFFPDADNIVTHLGLDRLADLPDGKRKAGLLKSGMATPRNTKPITPPFPALARSSECSLAILAKSADSSSRRLRMSEAVFRALFFSTSDAPGEILIRMRETSTRSELSALTCWDICRKARVDSSSTSLGVSVLLPAIYFLMRSK